MDQHHKTERILAMPAFHRLVARRNLVRFSLAFLVLVCHAFFVGGIAFYRDLFAQPINDGATLTLGIVFTAVVIVLFIVLEFVYVVVSDRVLDPQQQAVIDELASND